MASLTTTIPIAVAVAVALPALLALSVLRRNVGNGPGRSGRARHRLEEHLGVGFADRLIESDLALHPLGVLDLFGGEQRDDDAASSGPGRTAGAVDIGLVVLGRIEVEDRRHVVDVDAPCGHVGGDEGVDLAVDEVGQRSRALGLATAAVDGGGADAGLVELTGQAVRTVAGSAEHDGGPGRADRLGEHAGALCPWDLPEEVSGGGDVGGVLADLVVDGVALVVAGEFGDVTVEGRREQQGLAIGGRLLEQPTDCGHEAHVGHAVSLVEDDVVDGAEVDETLLDEVLEAARAGHEDVDAFAERSDLGPVADASVDDADADLAGEAADLLMDLLGQLAGRGQDQRPGHLRFGPLDVDGDRDAEGERLAGAGGSPSTHISAGEGVGDGGGLDGEGLGDAIAGERPADGVGDAQLGEGDGHCSPRPRVGRLHGFVSPRRVCRGRYSLGVVHDDRKNQCPSANPLEGNSHRSAPKGIGNRGPGHRLCRRAHPTGHTRSARPGRNARLRWMSGIVPRRASALHSAP